MNVPTKGSVVKVEGYGTGVFVKGPNMKAENPEVLLKFESQKRNNSELTDKIVSLSWEEFQRKRVYAEQQPKSDSFSEKWGNWEEKVNSALENLED
jgi:hypothetical protein